jgi:TATA-box binding protein (TBP) (component of TFIID and TFIIIB)
MNTDLLYDIFLKNNPNIKLLDPIDLPKDLIISTITQTCKIPIKFDVLSIARKFPLSKEFAVTVKCGNSGEIYRSLEKCIKKRRKNIKFNCDIKIKKSSKNFYNQVTIVVSTLDKIKINIKLFRNGAIQMTGSTNVSNVIWSLNKIFYTIKMMSYENKIEYAIPIISLDIRDIYNYKICMINSNFDIGFKINRDALFELLIKDGYNCAYDPARYAGVKLKYETGVSDNKHAATIPIFDSGAIIITGAKNYREIVECYKFINIYLIENYSKIVIL